MALNLNNWPAELAKLKLGMQRRHWNGTGEPDEAPYIVTIIGFSEQCLGWPIVSCPDYPEPVVANPVCLRPIKKPKTAKLVQDTFF